MKKYIILLSLFTISALFITGCKKEEKIVDELEIIKNRGYFVFGFKHDSPPFAYYNKEKQLVGIDIELAKKIAQEIFESDSQNHIKFAIVTPQNRIAKLNSKEVDILVATLSVNNKRKMVMDFSLPYFITSQKVLIRKTSEIKNLKYFNKNGSLTVVMGTTGEKILNSLVPNAKIIGANTYLEEINYLANSKVDGVIGDDAILSTFLTDDYKFLKHGYTKEFYSVAVRKNDNSLKLLEYINKAITTFLDEKNINLLTKM